SIFRCDSVGRSTMKCGVMVRPTTLTDCVKSSPQMNEEHKKDWLVHATKS
ncbi:hypothetical protein CROQUDRAFT_42954, partial [Cronartium quercuum f. sp. fusiforme G11]